MVCAHAVDAACTTPDRAREEGRGPRCSAGATPLALPLLTRRRAVANGCERHIEKLTSGCGLSHGLQQASRPADGLAVNLAALTGAVLAQPIEHRPQAGAALGRNETLDGSAGQVGAVDLKQVGAGLVCFDDPAIELDREVSHRREIEALDIALQ